MEHSIAEFYGDYYYPVILLDSSLKVTYKNVAAYAAKMQPRTGVNIKKYLSEENVKILRDISDRKADQRVIELKGRSDKCLARFADGMTALIFFASLNYMRDYGAEKAEQINKILAEYKELELLCVDECDIKKMQKIRAYSQRYIENNDFNKADSEKSYCNIWQFINDFYKGVSPFINNLGYRITFEIDEKDKMFIYKLNESDFLTLNFILLSYILSSSLFGNLNIKYESNTGAVVYEFMPVSDFDKSGNIDFKLAELIAANNNLELEFRTAEKNISYVEEKTQIWVRFILSNFSQEVVGNNILNSEDIASRAEIELAFLLANLK